MVQEKIVLSWRSTAFIRFLMGSRPHPPCIDSQFRPSGNRNPFTLVWMDHTED